MRITRLFLLAIVLTASLTTGITNATLRAVAQDKPLRQGKQSLSKQVRHELLVLPYYNVFDWLEFEIKDENTVVLRGQVIRPTTKSEAASRVDLIQGVEKVVNEIEVLPLSNLDNRLRRQIYRALFNFNSPLFYYGTQPVPSIHIIVKNGRVTLKGLVSNKTDSDLAYLKARGVPGSFEVKNELQIESDKE